MLQLLVPLTYSQSLFVTVANLGQLLLDIHLESFSKRYLSILSGTELYSGQGKTTRVKLLRHLFPPPAHHCSHSCTIFL